MTAWYMGEPMIRLLGLIRLHESGRPGYNADFRQDDKWVLTDKTFDQVRALGRSQVTTGGRTGGREASSAIAGYQFITATLDSLKRSLKLTGKEIMSPAFQDDLAVALMNGRGFMQFMRGEMSAETFANNLAKEWASLPVVTAIKGAHRTVTPGQSYYAGDGLNAALHKPATILTAVRALKTMAMPSASAAAVAEPAAEPVDRELPALTGDATAADAIAASAGVTNSPKPENAPAPAHALRWGLPDTIVVIIVVAVAGFFAAKAAGWL